jgi:hypothetical protein
MAQPNRGAVTVASLGFQPELPIDTEPVQSRRAATGGIELVANCRRSTTRRRWHLTTASADWVDPQTMTISGDTNGNWGCRYSPRSRGIRSACEVVRLLQSLFELIVNSFSTLIGNCCGNWHVKCRGNYPNQPRSDLYRRGAEDLWFAGGLKSRSTTKGWFRSENKTNQVIWAKESSGR